jgi:hypothetical protein
MLISKDQFMMNTIAILARLFQYEQPIEK